MFLLKKKKRKCSNETFLVVQWLRFLTSTAAGDGEGWSWPEAGEGVEGIFQAAW